MGERTECLTCGGMGDLAEPEGDCVDCGGTGVPPTPSPATGERETGR